MATHSGRNASVKLGTALIAGIGKWDLDTGRKEIDTTAFGSTWEKSDVGMGKWTGKFSGHSDLTDVQQTALWTYFKEGTLITDIRFYETATQYWAPDTVTDPDAGGRITALKIGQSKDGVASLDITISGSGPVELY